MAITELSPSKSDLPRRVPKLTLPAEAFFELPALEVFGLSLCNDEYTQAIGDSLDGQPVVSDTTTREFFSPLFNKGDMGRLRIRFAGGPISIQGLNTYITGLSVQRGGNQIMDQSIYFDYDHTVVGKHVDAIAPLDRAVTTIWVPTDFQAKKDS